MVEADLVLGSVAKVVEEPDAVAAEPMVAVAGILAEPVEPKGVVLEVFAEVVASMMFGIVPVSVMAVPTVPGPAAAALDGLEIDPKMMALAADLAAHESAPRVAESALALEAGPKMAEHLFVLVVALEADSRMAAFEGSRYL